MTPGPELNERYLKVLEERGFRERWSKRAWNNTDWNGRSVNVTFWSDTEHWAITVRNSQYRKIGTTPEELVTALAALA